MNVWLRNHSVRLDMTLNSKREESCCKREGPGDRFEGEGRGWGGGKGGKGEGGPNPDKLSEEKQPELIRSQRFKAIS